MPRRWDCIIFSTLEEEGILSILLWVTPLILSSLNSAQELVYIVRHPTSTKQIIYQM